jgi:hypothetical protein
MTASTRKKVSIHRQYFSPLGTSFIYFPSIYGKRRLVNEEIIKVNISLISLDHKYHRIPNELPPVGQRSPRILAVPARRPYKTSLVDRI